MASGHRRYPAFAGYILRWYIRRYPVCCAAMAGGYMKLVIWCSLYDGRWLYTLSGVSCMMAGGYMRLVIRRLLPRWRWLYTLLSGVSCMMSALFRGQRFVLLRSITQPKLHSIYTTKSPDQSPERHIIRNLCGNGDADVTFGKVKGRTACHLPSVFLCRLMLPPWALESAAPRGNRPVNRSVKVIGSGEKCVLIKLLQLEQWISPCKAAQPRGSAVLLLSSVNNDGVN
ncbi:hypothetical protein JOB18_048763 [Solea senegalensis]|uniref:Uncharacterized protein n=1 Tax=Solea senegalensis TaxID=28829 RepID=A0AAV6RFB1_SOLSE|nr:hypothetical protein JOB18_048763 [Solea senegalensis]